jgi:Cytochrome P460
MIKDNKKYASTKGWGWARFKTVQLVPYGKDALFTTECVDCHKPLKEEDFVFTMPIKN